MANERTMKVKIRELEKLLGMRKTTGDLLARMANEALRFLPSSTQRELLARWQKGSGPVSAETKLALQHEIGRLSSLTDARELLDRAATLLSVVPLGSSAAVDELLVQIGAFTGTPAARTVDADAALEHGQHRCTPASCPICLAFPNARARRELELRSPRPRLVGAAERGEAFAKSGDVADLVEGLEDPPEVTLEQLDADARTLSPESLAANNRGREILGIPQVAPAQAFAEAITDDALVGLLGLADVGVTAEEARSWTPEQREQAAQWAGAEHLHASDNPDVERLARPAFLPTRTVRALLEGGAELVEPLISKAQLDRFNASACKGIEIEPGVFSGCEPLPDGTRDCPVCSPTPGQLEEQLAKDAEARS